MKKIFALSLIALAFTVNAQITTGLIRLTETAEMDQNGSRRAVTSQSLLIGTENISSVIASGSGSLIYLRAPVKAPSGTITGYSVTSTVDQILTLTTSTAATSAWSNGSVSAPSGAWASEAASGWYRIGANDYGFSVNGTKVQEIAAAGVSLSGLTTMTTATAGTITTTGTFINAGTPQTLTGAGAVNLTTYSTLLVTTAADALTLAAGAEGQHKFIRMKTDGGDGTLTVTNLQGGTTITFSDAGDFVHLFYLDAKWHIIVNSGCAVA
jgi:hypothetical protein